VLQKGGGGKALGVLLRTGLEKIWDKAKSTVRKVVGPSSTVEEVLERKELPPTVKKILEDLQKKRTEKRLSDLPPTARKILSNRKK